MSKPKVYWVQKKHCWLNHPDPNYKKYPRKDWSQLIEKSVYDKAIEALKKYTQSVKAWPSECRTHPQTWAEKVLKELGEL